MWYDSKEVIRLRDIPVFSTQLGVASLVLRQVPYTKTAYVRIQDSLFASDFVKECVSFCKMAGAERVYAAGTCDFSEYPLTVSLIQMQADKSGIGTTDACLFPVTENTLEQWRRIYNEKAVRIPNGAWMTISDAEEMLHRGSGYFVHHKGTLLGIGKVEDNQLQWLASVQPGEGESVLKALCHAITEQTVVLEVADSNKKAMALYERMGFVPVKLLTQWYRVG